MRLPLRLVPRSLPVPVLQGKLRGKWWIAGASNHGCWLGSYEYDKRRLFEKIVSPGSIVFDVGANVGFYTMLASVLVGKGGSVYAFEPVPRNLHFLKRHMQMNRLKNVTVVEAAVSDYGGKAAFDVGAGPAVGRLETHGQLEVEVVNLDGLIKNGKVPPPDFIKLDIEGGEGAALRGARSTLAQSHPTIFLATHGPGVHRECCEFLQSMGYELQPICGQSLADTDEVLATREGHAPPGLGS